MPKLAYWWRTGIFLGCLGAVGCLLGQQASPEASPPTGPTLVFSSETNEYTAKPGDDSAPFTIYVTNVWTNAIVISDVITSCHCTVATLPANPWVLLPGASGAVSAHVELDGEEGVLTKVLTFSTSVGDWDVTLEVTIPPRPRQGDEPLTEEERKAAQLKAAADPRAIFQGDCAVCHVDKARGLLGQNLYVTACGICHDSPHRASMVPDLRALKQPTSKEYWKTMITYGKPHTLMPGFSQAQGGPLTDKQIESLAAYLQKAMPSRARTRQ